MGVILWQKKAFTDGQARLCRAVFSQGIEVSLTFEYLYNQDAMGVDVWMPLKEKDPPHEFMIDAACALSWVKASYELSQKERRQLDLGIDKAMDRMLNTVHYE